eukprot:GHRR01019856.1.p1 GENE.GHRR01019856.1~~GHRR01019856.1.p1  ORF type:complete len:375 (+),score=178.28 GHRR01019856.1:32-1126(+)
MPAAAAAPAPASTPAAAAAAPAAGQRHTVLSVHKPLLVTGVTGVNPSGVGADSSSRLESAGGAVTAAGGDDAAAGGAGGAGGAVPAKGKPGRPKGSGLATKPIRSIAVDDPVPGDVLRSIVRWLQDASTELAGPGPGQAAVTAKLRALAGRYSDFTERIQQYRRVPLPEELYTAFGVKQARRSGRVRTQATFYDPGNSETEGAYNDNPWKIRQGEEHQAILPDLQQRPASGPTAAEARYLSTPIYTPQHMQQQLQQQQHNDVEAATAAAMLAVQQRAASLGQQGLVQAQGSNPGLLLAPGQFLRLYRGAVNGDARRQLLAEWIEKSDNHLGLHLVKVSGMSYTIQFMLVCAVAGGLQGLQHALN